MNCCVRPAATEALAGVTAIDTSGFVTVSMAVPLIPLELAEMVTEPAVTPVARPALLMVATALLEDDQEAVPVRSLLLPSL